MKRLGYLAVAALVGWAMASSVAHAAAFKSPAECTRGRRVTDSSNKTGTVLSINQGTLCHVQLDGGGDNYYLFWMLHAAGGSAETNDKLRPGKYACYTLNDGHLQYTFMDVLITGPNTYRSGGQTFRFHEDGRSRQITFENGPLRGHPAKLSDGPSIVIGSTTCDLQKH